MQRTQITRWLWHADKIFFGVAMLICAAAVASFWSGSPRETTEPTVARASFQLPRWLPRERREPVLPDPSADIATDPDEYRPGPGEHTCVDPGCAYIMPNHVTWCPVCGTRQDDRDRDGMDDLFEQRHKATDPYVPDGHLDYDGDKFTNKEEYDAGSNPDDPSSIPAPVRFVGVGQELVDVLFRGFCEQPDGQIVVQLNWGNDTHTNILGLGSSFRGYELVKLNTCLVERGSPEHGTDYTEIDYELILKRAGGDHLVLPRNTPVREPERYGTFASAETPTRTARAYAGQTFKLDGHSYMVNEVSPQSAHLIGDRGEHHILELRPERPR